MAIERTYTMIKPDAYRDGNMGNIIAMIEKAGFKIVHARLMKFTTKSAEQFYEVHKGKPFFQGLVEFITSDKVMAMTLEKENAVEDFRKLIGATDPKKAEPNTIRAQYAKSISSNAIHASDSIINAKTEITYIFGEFASVPSVEKENAKEY